MKKQMYKWSWSIIALLASSLLLVGCSTTNSTASKEDPLEGLNRKIYTFNCFVDKGVIRPIAKGYDFIMPNPAQKGVTNFFDNINEIPNVANDILQVRIAWALVDSWRFILNSTIGIAGLVDMASIMGLPKHKQDFGLTLARWGYKNSTYLMLPILGPSTVRDTLSIPANVILSPLYYLKPRRDAIALEVINVINTRANLLATDRLLDEVFDQYIFIRDAYLQKRVYNAILN